LVFFLILILPSVSNAAACCGGAFGVPSLILGDDRAQFTGSVAGSQVETDVGSDGHWTRRKDPQNIQIYRLEGAHLISDRWQVGALLPLQFNQRPNPNGPSKGQDIGDVALNVAYEALPEWEYSEWRPRGLVFMQLVVPTGRAAFQSANDSASLDVTGHGFYSLGAGTALTKVFGHWDTLFLFEAHRSFSRTIHDLIENAPMTARPGWGGTSSISLGYNFQQIRLGGAVSLTYEDPVGIDGSVSTAGSLERYALVSLSGAYLLSDRWATSLTYSNSSWIGAPVTTSLGQTVLLALQKRWPR
jgi:hypothetical protein